VSFAVAHATIARLLSLVADHSFGTFIVYRLGVATVLLGALATGHLAG